MNRAAVFLLATLAPLAPNAARAQSLNIAFGPQATAPSSAYSAAGGVAASGVWNPVGLLATSQRQALVGLHGAPTNARIYQIGASSILTHDNPGTGGDDGRLLDDMYISMNNPVDACFWVEGLRNGTYEVILYALTPDDPNRLCRTRVDFALEGPAMVGGEWSGAHREGVTFSRFTVTTSNGVIGLHSGLFNGFIQSGLNGIQVISPTECRADFNSSGTITIDDLFTFLASFFASAPGADFDASGAIGVQDLFSFLDAYFTPCP